MPQSIYLTADFGAVKLGQLSTVRRRQMFGRIGLWCCVLLLCGACQHNQPQRVENNNGATQQAEGNGAEKMTIKLTSSAFQEGGLIPVQYTCEGQNVSPPLAWDTVPAETKTLALIA